MQTGATDGEFAMTAMEGRNVGFEGSKNRLPGKACMQAGAMEGRFSNLAGAKTAGVDAHQ